MKREKNVTSFKLGVLSIIIFFIVSILVDEFIFAQRVYSILRIIPSPWRIFLIYLPVMIIAGFGLVYGIESIKSSRRTYALLGVLFSLVSLFLLIARLVGGACC